MWDDTQLLHNLMGNKYNEEEDAFLLHNWGQPGKPASWIGRRLSRTKNSVIGRHARLVLKLAEAPPAHLKKLEEMYYKKPQPKETGVVSLFDEVEFIKPITDAQKMSRR